jgi:opacity protein-like surface antigen
MNNTIRLVASTLLSTPLCALAAGPWDNQFGIFVGVMNADASTNVRLDANNGRVGTSLSFEGDLNGEERKAVPTLDFFWRFNPRHAIEGSFVTLSRDGNRTLTGTINFGDATFPVNTTVNSSFDSDIFRFAYRWSPWHDDAGEFSLLLGLHYTSMKVAISGTGGTVSEDASVKYPLPTIGVRGSARITDNWRVNGFAQVLKLKIGDYDGSLYNLGAGLEWAFSHEMLAGLGYDYYKYELTSTKDNARGQFDYRFDGPKLYFGWTFK